MKKLLLPLSLLLTSLTCFGAAYTPEQIKKYREMAEQGDAKAQYALGLMYDDGEGVLEDDKEAAKWYRKAAEQGNDLAQQKLEAIDDSELSSASLNKVLGDFHLEMVDTVSPKDDMMPGAYGEFGRTKTNPIPVNGIHSISIYLENLSRKDGVDFTWDRLGSTPSDNISGIIDIYEIYDEDKVSIDTLYICAYSSKTTNLVPSGYNKID
jgi:hypothetical protein